MMPARRRSFRPLVESLEDRVVPAGTIVTKFNLGTLTITGQSSVNPALQDQKFAILGAGNGHVSIAVQDGETISGKNSFVKVRRLVVRTNEGNDQVTIVDLKMARKNDTVDINMGTGDDTLLFDGENINLWNFGLSSGAAATAATDTLTVDAEHPVRSKFVNFTINAPNAQCDLVLGGMGVTGTTRITTSATKADSLQLDDAELNTFICSTGDGGDVIILGNLDQDDGEDLNFNGNTTFNLGAGNDTFTAGIIMHDPTGQGDDIKHDFTRFKKQVLLDGGAGFDTINTHHPRSTEFVLDDYPIINNFETILYNRYDPIIVSDTEVSIDEGTTVVQTLLATDLDGDPISFAIFGGPDASQFTITGGNQLEFVNAPDFDNPTDSNLDNVYIVSILASDGVGGQSVKTITVTVLDV